MLCSTPKRKRNVIITMAGGKSYSQKKRPDGSGRMSRIL
jgi:hypothetical protein